MAALAWLLVGGGAVAVCARTKAGVRTVTIDAGHGGKDPGTLGPNSKEKDVTLAVALRLGEKIRAKHPEVKVIYTRDKDEFIPLDERSAIANVAKSDLFISIHCNSAGATVAKGVETFVMGWHMAEDQFEVAKRENSVITFEQDYSQKYNHFDPNSPESYIIFSLMQNVFHDQSIEFATLVQQNFVKKNNRFDREVKQAGFLVLYKSSMPAVLIELGFLSNRKEESYLLSPKGQEETAEAIAQAFDTYAKRREVSLLEKVTSDSARADTASRPWAGATSYRWRPSMSASDRSIPYDANSRILSNCMRGNATAISPIAMAPTRRQKGIFKLLRKSIRMRSSPRSRIEAEAPGTDRNVQFLN